MDEGEEVSGGAESDIRTLHYWSRVAFLFIVCGGVVWAALGVLRLYRGLVWYELDDITGSTASVDDLSWGVACLVLAALSFMTAGRLQLDIVSVFGERRFQVPRERLAVYGMLGFPFGLVGAGVLLVLVNVKLSNPSFLPSHAEAYPDAMPGCVLTRAEGAVQGPVGGERELPPMVPRAAAELPPLDLAQPPRSEMVVMSVPPSQQAAAAPAAQAPVVAPPPEAGAIAAVYEEMPAPAEAAPVAAVVEEVPPQGGAAPAAAAVEDVPVAAVYEEVAPEPAPAPEPAQPSQEPPAPKDIKSAHEELMRKLLKK